MMKNAFYFKLKALFDLEIFTFLSCLFGYAEKWLDKKAMVIFEIYDVTDCITIITIHTFTNTSKRKGDQTIKFGQLIEYNMRNIS